MTTMILMTVLGTAQVNETVTGTDLKTMLTEAITEEYLARATYEAILVKWPGRKPFANIVRAEGQHAKMVTMLLNNHKIPVPSDEFARRKEESDAAFMARLKVPADWAGALKVGVKIEKEDVAFLGKALKDPSLPSDVRQVFDRLLVVSRDHHLAAFERALGR